MSLATETLKQQKRIYFTYIWRGLALMAIGAYCAFMILKNGMGTAVQTGGGANVLLRKLMPWLTERGINAEQLLPLFMVGAFLIIAAIGLFNLLRGTWLMASPHTMLGKSILTQRRGHESFRDIVEDINADMNQEPYVFGSVSIGRKWILDIEAMRLADIRGVFWFDHDKEDYVLCCVDEAQNIWAASLRDRDDRDRAADYLEKILPDAATGDMEDYKAFLGGELTDDDESPDAVAIPAALAPDATLCFMGADGIPTSNFTFETACTALHALDSSQTIALRVLTPKDSVVTAVSFTRIVNGWNIGVFCRQDDEESRIVKPVNKNKIESILEALIKNKQLPDLYTSSKQ